MEKPKKNSHKWYLNICQMDSSETLYIYLEIHSAHLFNKFFCFFSTPVYYVHASSNPLNKISPGSPIDIYLTLNTPWAFVNSNWLILRKSMKNYLNKYAQIMKYCDILDRTGIERCSVIHSRSPDKSVFTRIEFVTARTSCRHAD